MNPLKLSVDDAVVVVVDMQERLLPAIHEAERVIANTGILIQAATTLGLPVVITTQYLKGLGPTHAAVAALAPAVVPFDKLTFSCLGSPEFTAAVNATGRKTLLLCGVEAHICVLQTGLDAVAAGYTVHVVADATGSRQARNAEIGHRRLEKAGAVITCTESAVYELLGASGTPAFKSLLPHFK